MGDHINVFFIGPIYGCFTGQKKKVVVITEVAIRQGSTVLRRGEAIT